MHRASATNTPRQRAYWWALLLCGLLIYGSGCTPSRLTSQGMPQASKTTPAYTLQGVQPSAHGVTTQVVITTSGAVQPLVQRLAKPDRLIVDLPYTQLPASWPQREMAVADGRLRAIQTTPTSASGVRLTLLLQTIRDYRIGVQSAPNRVIVELFGTETTARAAGSKPQKLSPARGKATTFAARVGLPPASQTPLIVIDPGHGGHDTGAIGPTGLTEKAVVLQIARELRQLLQQTMPQYRVLLTRDRDVFIPLGERANIANQRQAQVFISIHANSSPNHEARGIETWHLSFAASARAKQIAARENRLSETQQSTLELILRDMHETDRINQSTVLARATQQAVVAHAAAHYPGVVPRRVEGAPFVVLHRTKMPSILVETAFISNPEEEARLRSPHYHRVLAQGIVQGLRQFLQTIVVAQQ